MLVALAFLPENDVSAAFEDLVDVLPHEAISIADYFEDTFIGRRRRGFRVNPLFPIPIWSVYVRVLEGSQRTNNSVEGWHRGLQANIDCHNPNFWKFLDCLKKEKALLEMKIARLEAGGPPNPKRARYEALDRRIYNVVSSYSDGDDRVAYLRQLTYSFAS